MIGCSSSGTGDGPDSIHSLDMLTPDVPTTDVSGNVDDGTSSRDVEELPDTTEGPGEDLSPGETTEPQGVISEYLTCQTDADCPIGYGDCLTAIQFNRRDENGVSSVPVSALDPDVTGICTLACSTSDTPCSSLTIKDSRGASVPYQCQVVVVGSLPYPTSMPDFPFDDQLNLEALAAGQAFGAICRPPFGLSVHYEGTFCTVCSDSDECGQGLCWNFLQDLENSINRGGVCLEPCAEDAPCPLGFACEELFVDHEEAESHGNFCVPVQGTCGNCRDLDGDGRGLGRCGPASKPVTAFDCNDYDARAYYDSAKPNHAFPDHCGHHDLNCNGISDAVEQVGPGSFGTEHCTGCYEPCSGTILNGNLACGSRDGVGACVASCADPTAFADCDGVASNGCETAVDDPSKLYYLDADGDGFGAGPAHFSCDGSGAPEGYVSIYGDCDDDIEHGASVHPGALEVCNGIDDDCNGHADDAPAGVGEPCDSGIPGICADGSTQCIGGTIKCVQLLQPRAETCNGQDDNCDGEIDNGLAGVGGDCTLTELFGECAKGKMGCDPQQGIVCQQVIWPTQEDRPDKYGTDSNCDGIDGDISKAIFVDSTKNDQNDGTKAKPVRTLAKALDLARTQGKKQILMAGGVYDIDEPVTLIPGVSIYGGFESDTWLRSLDSRAGIRRVGKSTDQEVIVLQGSGIGAGGELFLEDIDIDASVHSDAAGASVYGIVCVECTHLRLTRASVYTGRGGDGTDGADGLAGNNGEQSIYHPSESKGRETACSANSSSGKGGNSCWTGTTTIVRAAQPGQPSGLGGNAGVNSDGGHGKPSTVRAQGGLPETGGIEEGLHPIWRWLANSTPASDGPFGGGGGGGACYDLETVKIAGFGGSSGGCGGKAGGSGMSGGSSVALLVSSSVGTDKGVILEDVTLSSGSGGKGGNGGSGGSGGVGGAESFHPEYVYVFKGGAGGNGGGGGGGAGGNGGHSCAILRNSKSLITTEGGNVSLEISYAGSKGAGGDGGIGGVSIHGGTGTTGFAGAAGEDGKAQQQCVLW